MKTMRAQFSCHLSASLKKENQGEVEQIGLQSYGRLPSANVQLLPPSFSKGRTRRERCWWDASSAVHQGGRCMHRHRQAAHGEGTLHFTPTWVRRGGDTYPYLDGVGGLRAWACLHGTLIGALIEYSSLLPCIRSLGRRPLTPGPRVT